MLEKYFCQNFRAAMTDSAIQWRCPAKLNLFLDVRGKRDDGFHEIETVMAPVSLSDRLTFASTSDPQISLEVTGRRREHLLGIPLDDSNLVSTALRGFQHECKVQLGARVVLEKRIPTQAGLGGASSDAATALMAANRLWKIGWPLNRLARWSAQFGSDIPFFFCRDWAVCRGRGERVESIPGGLRCPIVIVKPPEGLATADVYRKHLPVEHPLRAEPIVSAIAAGSFSRIARRMFNRLQFAACQLSTWPERLQQRFRRLGAIGHQLAGSGSSYFGVFRALSTANWAGQKLAQELPECRVIMCELLSPQCKRKN